MSRQYWIRSWSWAWGHNLMGCHWLSYPHLLFFHVDAVLALIVVPAISLGIRAFGKYLRDLSHKTQAAAALAGSIAEVLPSEVSPTVWWLEKQLKSYLKGSTTRSCEHEWWNWVALDHHRSLLVQLELCAHLQMRNMNACAMLRKWMTLSSWVFNKLYVPSILCLHCQVVFGGFW